jgi:hypothetical protein
LRGIYFPPCCGTTETDEKRISREDLPPYGFRSRLSTIFSDVAASGVLHPTTKVFAWYNRVSHSPCPFIVKLTMEPAVYHQVYLKHYGIAIDESAESAQRFQDDYYGDRVLMVYQAAQVGNAVPAGNAGSRMLRANDEDVLKTGAVLWFNTTPLLLEELTDEIMTSAEATVVDAFRLHCKQPKPFWHSICLQPLLTDASAFNRDDTRFLIGCKMDEGTFATALPTRELQEKFLKLFPTLSSHLYSLRHSRRM